MTRKFLVWTGVLTALLCGKPQAQQELNNQGRTFVTFAPTNTVTVTPGHKSPVAFTFRVEKGYHINSNTPSAEELIPTQLHFTLPGEIVIGKVQYPPGEMRSFPFDPTQKLSVYSGDVVIHAMVIAPAQAQPGPLTVHGELKYQACDNNACYPPKKLPITFNVRIGASTGRPRARSNAQSPHIH